MAQGEIAGQSATLIISRVRVPRLYCPTLALGGNVLSDEESHHAATVLRLREGDRVVLFDGLGHEAASVLQRVRSRQVEATVESIVARPFETVHRITLAVATAKAHRQAYLIEKCTELGVAGFWPIVSERSVAEPGDSAVEKWLRRAVEAAKQSHRAWLPTFREPQELCRAAERTGEFAAAALADPDAEQPWPSLLARQPADAAVLVFVGPEGGFTPQERDLLIGAGVLPVRLAPTILRTETAAIAVCASEAAISSFPRLTGMT